jgi:hypothetical protein
MNFTILDIFYILKKVDKFSVQDIFTPLISFEVFIVSGPKKMRQCGNEALLDKNKFEVDLYIPMFILHDHLTGALR